MSVKPRDLLFRRRPDVELKSRVASQQTQILFFLTNLLQGDPIAVEDIQKIIRSLVKEYRFLITDQ